MKVVGLTGGIGSGKTTVANFFKDHGVPIYIADDEAKKLMTDDAVKDEIIALLGDESYGPSGKPDRKYIASQVFENEELLKKLNQIIHPRVGEHFAQWLEKQDAAYVLYEAAILFETQKYQELDYTILVTAPKQVRIARLKKRDNSSESQIRARMENQWPDSRKKKLADFVIENRDLIRTKAQVSKFHSFLSSL